MPPRECLMKWIFTIFLRKSYHCHTCFGCAHGWNKNFCRIILIDPKKQFVSRLEPTFNKAKGKSTWIPIKFFHGPIKSLLIKPYRIEHVIWRYCNFELSSNCVRWKFRVHFYKNTLTIWIIVRSIDFKIILLTFYRVLSLIDIQ